MLLNRDKEIVRHILEYCKEISHTMDSFGRNAESFYGNTIYQNATALCVLQIGELTTHFSEEFKERYNRMPWSQMRGMRNIVAHHYGRLDKEVLWETLCADIPELQGYCEEILQES